ncbi:hypothetical protein M378DRAFT_21254 [Amanita muscaria Koide BX008]|uniref:Thioredoxin domain-containing protein n=1 Tax=Amanita muscaria (strain Koide BX008) TaxID=946122 RepID=A0A0C2TRP3_AMAMK|nr:hypothetical protein M378DRAFT_21254 [Amanita muscaria Koide BX008]
MSSTLYRAQASLVGRLWRRRFHSSPLFRDVYKDVDQQTFTKVIEAKDRLVLVDFYADWCGPCRQLSPILERLGADSSVKSGATGYPVDLVKVDVESDDGAILAGKYGVSALPTVVALRNGEKVDHFRGSLSEPAVLKFIEKL